MAKIDPRMVKWEDEAPAKINPRMVKWDEPQADHMTAEALDPTIGMSTTDKLRAGAGKAFADIWRGAKQVTGFADQSEIDEARRLDAPLMKTGAGAVGNVAGNVAVALPTMFVPGANTYAGASLTGAALGAIQPTATGESRAFNTGAGAIGGAVGKGIGDVIGRVARPVQSNLGPVEQGLAAKASAAGIPLDAADLTGSKPLAVTRSVFSNLPMTAGKEAEKATIKQAAFNRAVSRTFGENADSLTPDIMGAARRKIGDKFTQLSIKNTLRADAQFTDDLSRIANDLQRYAPDDVQRSVMNRLDDVISKVESGDVIPGRSYREIDSAIGRQMRSTTNGDLKNYLGQLRDSLRSAMDRSITPADKMAWDAARKQYANLMTVAPVAAKNEAGDVSGRSLLSAVNSANKSARFGSGGELGELGRVGRAFIGDSIPDSGTAQRVFVQNLLTGGAGAGLGYLGSGGDPTAAALGAAGMVGLPKAAQIAINNPAVQAYLARGLLSQPIAAQVGRVGTPLLTGAGAGGGLLFANP